MVEMAYKDDLTLRLASEHVEYELKMLYSLRKVNLKVKKPKIRNSHLEAFLVHARNLCEFLYSKPKNDTVSARHFFDDPEYWAVKGPKKSDFLRQNIRDMNKYLSHITYTRIQGIKWWEIEKIALEINSAFDAFLKSVSENRLCEKLVKRKHYMPENIF